MRSAFDNFGASESLLIKISLIKNDNIKNSFQILSPCRVIDNKFKSNWYYTPLPYSFSPLVQVPPIIFIDKFETPGLLFRQAKLIIIGRSI